MEMTQTHHTLPWNGKVCLQKTRKRVELPELNQWDRERSEHHLNEVKMMNKYV
jgi:hypothetical protein